MSFLFHYYHFLLDKSTQLYYIIYDGNLERLNETFMEEMRRECYFNLSNQV